MAELSNEEILDRFADLIEPACEILADTEIREQAKDGTKAAIAALAIKRHKAAVIRILAVTDGVPVEGYKVNPFMIPVKLIRLLNMPEVKDLFTGQAQTTAEGFSGSATASTGDGVR